MPPPEPKLLSKLLYWYITITYYRAKHLYYTDVLKDMGEYTLQLINAIVINLSYCKLRLIMNQLMITVFIKSIQLK